MAFIENVPYIMVDEEGFRDNYGDNADAAVVLRNFVFMITDLNEDGDVLEITDTSGMVIKMPHRLYRSVGFWFTVDESKYFSTDVQKYVPGFETEEQPRYTLCYHDIISQETNSIAVFTENVRLAVDCMLDMKKLGSPVDFVRVTAYGTTYKLDSKDAAEKYVNLIMKMRDIKYIEIKLDSLKVKSN